MDNQNFQNNTYEQPGHQQYEPPRGTDPLAIVSLILGIAAIVMGCCFTYLAIGLGIGGIVCSVLSIKKQKSGMAIAGMVCSIIGIVIAVVWIIFSVALLSMLQSAGYDLSDLTNF